MRLDRDLIRRGHYGQRSCKPHLKAEPMETSFMVYLFLSNLGQSWAMGYLLAFLVDSTIVAYSIAYFISDQGRPQRWIVASKG
jgi:hypothetical protein